MSSLNMLARRVLNAIWRLVVPDLIVRKKIGELVLNISLRHHAALVWDQFGEESIQLPSSGLMWDLGCNVGYYTLKAASQGCRVVAFDISPINLSVLEQSVRDYGLEDKVKTVLSPVTTVERKWSASESGSPSAACEFKVGSGNKSITYLQAAKLFGVPSFIKMDIEGGEKEFLVDDRFHNWLQTYGINFVVEVHGDNHRYVSSEYSQIGPNQYIRESAA